MKNNWEFMDDWNHQLVTPPVPDISNYTLLIPDY